MYNRVMVFMMYTQVIQLCLCVCVCVCACVCVDQFSFEIDQIYNVITVCCLDQEMRSHEQFDIFWRRARSVTTYFEIYT